MQMVNAPKSVIVNGKTQRSHSAWNTSAVPRGTKLTFQENTEDGPFQEHVELNGVKKNVPVTVTLNQKQKALAIVKYTSGKNKITSDKVVVSVDGKPNVLIPVSFKKVETAYEEEEEVYRESTELDFGCVVVNRKTVAREISLVNYGSKTGAFRIKYEGSRLIEFIPTSGSVPPNRELRIKVKLETKHPGKIEEKVEVTLGHETKSMHVRANVLESEDMLDQKTEDMPSAMERDTIQVCPENLKIEEPQDTVEEPDSLIQSSTGRRKRCVVFSVVMISVAVVAVVATVLAVYFTEGF